MAATEQLRKENEELRNDISELQKKLDKITEEMSKIYDKTDQIEAAMLRRTKKSIYTVCNAWFTLVVRIGDCHCLWSLVCKMLCLLEKNTIDRR
jgi:predicted nuclease with TOPRIM domain